jgi:lipopolysaccharide biosynthesis glycosyltransferase
MKPLVVYAATEAYALPLAASLTSLAATSFRGGAALTIVDAGLSSTARTRLRRCVPADWDLSFVAMQPEWIHGLPDPGRFSRAAYARFFIGEIASAASRALYLDADTLPLQPVDELMELDLGGAVIAAVRDEYIPTFSSHPAMARHRVRRSDLSRPYFNSGVLVIDIEKWNRLRVSRRASAYLREVAGTVEYVDQDALNVALRGRWAELGAEWNVGRYWYRPERRQGLFSDIVERARILHYTTEYKPWLMPDTVPDWARLPFFRSLERTAWMQRGTQRMQTHIEA